MIAWLLDTNVLSELRRPKPDRKVLAFVAAQSLDCLYVSTVTLAEIRFGIELPSDASLRADLINWLTHKVRPMFEQRFARVGGHHIQVALAGRKWSQGGTHLLTTGSVYRSNGVATCTDRGIP